ncbi:MAG: exodeoxyribonuclease VII small subunit [Alkalispirochaeta sp.]|jgi:exodeoxyribonuclease VII small subunit
MSDFETQLKRLETISEQLRNGEIPIDTATKLFEEGMVLSGSLDRELQNMERRIEVLVNDPADVEDKPEFSLFDAEEEKEA